MNLAKTSQYLLIIYFAFLIAIKPISLIAFWILTIFGLYWMIKDKINPFKIDSIKNSSLILFLFFIAMLISVVVSNMPHNSYSHLGRIAYLLFAPITAVAIYKSNISAKKFIFATKIGAIVAGSIVFIQAIISHFDFVRLSGMYNANTFGDIAVLLTILSLSFISKENKKELTLTIFALIFGVIAIIFSGSRGSFLGFSFLIFLYIIINSIYNKKAKKVVVFVALISIFLSIFAFALDKGIENRFGIINHQIDNWKSGKSKTTSVGARLEMYTSGIKAFKDSPIFGYGYHECGEAAAKYASQTKAVQNDFKGRWHLHNELLTASVNAGIIGTIALLYLYFVPLIFFAKRLKNSLLARGGLLFMLGIITLGTTHTMLGYEYETSLIVVIIVYFMFKTQKEIKTGTINV